MARWKDTEEDLNKRISFLSEYILSLREQIPTDIQLKPNDGPAIPAHKSLLVARSVIFKSMLESDGCIKPPPSDVDSLSLSELNTGELNSFLEFLYTGNLLPDKMKKHVFSLYVAADKYEIPYLEERCERCVLSSMNKSNAVRIFKFADAHSFKKIKETALNFIVGNGNKKDIISSKEYEDFANKNPHLSLQITRALAGCNK